VSERSKKHQTRWRPTARRPTRLVPCPAPPPPPRGGAGGRHSGGDGGSDSGGSAAGAAPFMMRGGGGAGLSTGRVGGVEGTTATHGDAAPEGEWPPGVAPLDDERGTTAAHVRADPPMSHSANIGATCLTWLNVAAYAESITHSNLFYADPTTNGGYRLVKPIIFHDKSFRIKIIRVHRPFAIWGPGLHRGPRCGHRGHISNGSEPI